MRISGKPRRIKRKPGSRHQMRRFGVRRSLRRRM